jgi:hypothetical protein
VRWTIVIFGANGRPATNLRLSAERLMAITLLLACALASALWLGWQVGELTASL